MMKKLTLIIGIFISLTVNGQTRARVSLGQIPPYTLNSLDGKYIFDCVPYNSIGSVGMMRLMTKDHQYTILEIDTFCGLGQTFLNEKNEIIHINRVFYPRPDFDNVAISTFKNGQWNRRGIKDIVDIIPEDIIDDFTWLDSITNYNGQIVVWSRFINGRHKIIDTGFTLVDRLPDTNAVIPQRDLPKLQQDLRLTEAFNFQNDTYRIWFDSDDTTTTSMFDDYIFGAILVDFKTKKAQLLPMNEFNNFSNPKYKSFYKTLDEFVRKCIFDIEYDDQRIDKWCYHEWIIFEKK